MNKEEIINTLNKYNIDKNEFYIISGAALCLLGYKDSAKDIDICVSDNLYNYLIKEYNAVFERTNEYGHDAYMIDNVINFGKDFMPKEYVLIDGYKVSSLKDIYELKKFLNRDKDKELLKKLEEVLNDK